MSNIVNVEWLLKNLKNNNLIIADCRFSLMDKDYGKNSYNNEHIEGAVFVDIETQLSAPVKEHGGRHPLPSVQELKNTIESIGISNDSVVVAYDEGDLAGPSRLWWILKYLGHDKVYVLNGGIEAFKEIGGVVTSQPTTIEKGNFEVDLQDKMRVDMKYVKERLHNDKIAIVDCRENKRYRGEFEPVDKKAGHIPGALNYFWMNALNNDNDKLTMKNEEDLKKYYAKLNDYEEVIIYCGSGITASPVSLSLSQAKIDHKLYAGSFSDWISYDENIVETENI